METKLFEIRDSMTFIPAFAIKMQPDEGSEVQAFLLRRAGYSCQPDDPIIMFGYLGTGGRAHCDPYAWGRDTGTMPEAHNYIMNNWYDLKDGDVIDVQFIRGETSEKKKSERLDFDY